MEVTTFYTTTVSEAKQVVDFYEETHDINDPTAWVQVAPIEADRCFLRVTTGWKDIFSYRSDHDTVVISWFEMNNKLSAEVMDARMPASNKNAHPDWSRAKEQGTVDCYAC